MNNNSQFSQEQYYDLVAGLLRQDGHRQSPDRSLVYEDYELDKTPEESAKEFAEAWS